MAERWLEIKGCKGETWFVEARKISYFSISRSGASWVNFAGEGNKKGIYFQVDQNKELIKYLKQNSIKNKK